MIHVATSFLFLASCCEGYDALGFPFEIIRGKFGSIPWTIPMTALLALLSLEMVFIAQFRRSGRFLWASILKPITISIVPPKLAMPWLPWVGLRPLSLVSWWWNCCLFYPLPLPHVSCTIVLILSITYRLHGFHFFNCPRLLLNQGKCSQWL